MIYKKRRKLQRSVQLNSHYKDWKIAQYQVKWNQCSVCLCTCASVHESGHVVGCVLIPQAFEK